ncbi:unnamed protein product [Chironomus riparius]|uniref:Uncharacterized protein n=1 Tax=Chironomus riparius TaxID=315576 RepID=A0A9N9WN10_9DIPT|nr:unnamed protein product [Chironomus riparius]
MDGRYSLMSITKHETSKILKFSWIIVLCASFFGLCFYVKGCYEKLTTNPEILVNEKHIPSFDIPFPAITICSPLNIKMEYSNLSIIREDVKQNKILSSEAETMLARSAHVCQTDFLHFEKISSNKSYNEDILNTLNAQSYQINDEFVKCAVDEIPHKCENVFIQSMTEYGYCYTFNMVGYNSMFQGNLASEYDIYKRKKIAKTWSKTTDLEFHDDDEDAEDLTFSIDEGYLKESYDIQPLRAAKLQSLMFALKIKKIDVPNICEYHPLTYFVYLHLPVNIPSHMSHFTVAQLNTYKISQISAAMKTLDESMKDFSPEKRRCYFENERKLQFFKTYSKRKCEFECMRNFTLTQCGCVKLSLLRTDEDKLCDARSLACYKAISKSWPNSYYKNRKIKRDVIDFPCYCLPQCTQIKYEIVNEHTRDIKLSDFNSSDEFIYTKMSIIFIDSEIIETTNYVTYRVQNFISDIGGLAGLFLGFSLLSLFEIILGIMSLCKKMLRRLRRKKNDRIGSIQKLRIPQEILKSRPRIRIVDEKSINQDQKLKKSEIELKYDRYIYNKW